jgi:hypothetical protein
MLPLADLRSSQPNPLAATKPRQYLIYDNTLYEIG